MTGGQNKHGFTIVELLIVIVVIAILAALTVVAFTSVQQRAANTSIAQTANGWMRVLKLSKAETGRWPNGGFTCLGEGYLYGVSGTDPTGTAQCRQTGATGYTEQTAFKNAMRPYFNNGPLPNPIFITAVDTNGDWRRGIHYAYGGGSGTDVYLQIAYKGDVGTCPSLQGVSGSKALWTGNSMCHYTIGQTTD